MKKKKIRDAGIVANANRIIRFLKRKGKSLSPFLILMHDFPDPDALASAFALQYLARKECGIVSKIAYGGLIGRTENRTMVKILKIPAYKLRAGDLESGVNIATVDTQPEFKNNSFPKGRRAALVIDQHSSDHLPAADLAVIDTQCGATSVILAQCLFLSKIRIPVRLATALAYGILSDTQDFFRCSHPNVLQTYLMTLEHSDLRLLARIRNPPRSAEFFTTLGKGIRNAVVGGQLMVSNLGDVLSPDRVSQTADFLLPYRGVSWSFCMGRYKDDLYFSIRGTCADFQAGEVLRAICENRGQAGGHDTIAGGSIRVGKSSSVSVWEKTEKVLVERLIKRLRIPPKSCFYHPFR